MLGRWMSDLEVGDVLGPIDHRVSPFLIREYAHAVEVSTERHQGTDGLLAPPTIVHTDKKRLMEYACPQGAGPQARLHLVYDAKYHEMLPAGTDVSISGEVTERFERKGREHVVITFEVRDKSTGLLYTAYKDTSLLNYRANS
jgi:hypothetical protein